MDRKRFLFLGNSHTYFNDMPAIFADFCREGGFCDPEIMVLTAPNMTYQDHLQRETSLRFALVYGGFDYLIMQQAAHSPCPTADETLRDGKEIIRHARSLGVTPVQILPWAEKARPDRQEGINAIYETLSQQTGVELARVGDVFARARRETALPDLYWTDGAHASCWGSYAIAAYLYSFLSGHSCIGLSTQTRSYAKASATRSQDEWQAVRIALDPEICLRLQTLVDQIIGNVAGDYSVAQSSESLRHCTSSAASGDRA